MIRRRPTTAACATALWLALSGACSPASLTAPPPAAVGLSISYTDGGARHSSAGLTCRSGVAHATGFLLHRSVSLLCGRARALRAFLGSPPKGGRLCSQIYGGPDRALIRGRIGTTVVHRWFTRTDGCQIADWSRARLLLPTPRGAA